MQQGREIGREEGIQEERIKTAAKLKKLEIETSLTAQATGLTPEEIENLWFTLSWSCQSGTWLLTKMHTGASGYSLGCIGWRSLLHRATKPHPFGKASNMPESGIRTHIKSLKIFWVQNNILSHALAISISLIFGLFFTILYLYQGYNPIFYAFSS